MIPFTRNRHAWGFACGRVSVLESRLVTSEFLLALVSLERTDDLLHRLQETQVREYLVPGATWEDWSAIIDTCLHDQVLSLRENSPDPALTSLFLLANDYLNIKRALLNAGAYPFDPGMFGSDMLGAVAAGNTAMLPPELRDPLVALGGQWATDPDARLVLDLVLDGAYLRQMRNIGAALSVPWILWWLDEMILAQAAVTLYRAARAGIPFRLCQQHFLPMEPHDLLLAELMSVPDAGNWGALLPGEMGRLWAEAAQEPEDERVSRFGVMYYNYLTALARRVKLQTVGPERVFGYLWGLRVEAYNLKLIINGRLNGIDPDLLRRRLKEAYV